MQCNAIPFYNSTSHIHHSTSDSSPNNRLFTQQPIIHSTSDYSLNKRSSSLNKQPSSLKKQSSSVNNLYLIPVYCFHDQIFTCWRMARMMAWTVIHRPSSSAPERVIIILNLYTHTPIYAYKIIWLRRLDGRNHFQTILISLRRRLLHEVKILYTVEAHISLGHHFVVFRPKTITLAFNFVILLFLVFINTWVKSLSRI